MTSLSESFSLPSNSYVILASSSSQGDPFGSVSSPFSVLVSKSSSCCSSVMFADAELPSGANSLSVNYNNCSPALCPPNYDSTSPGIGVVLYIFPIGSTDSSSTTTTTSISTTTSYFNNFFLLRKLRRLVE